MSVTSAVRTIDGVEVPSPGVWMTDPAHTVVGFSARHLMVTKVRGRFDDAEGTIEVGGSIEDSRVEVRIGAASITTNEPQRDQHLRSPDFLDVDRFPELTFESTSVERTGKRTLRIEGNLTIRDVTRPVTLEAEYLGMVTDPWGTPKFAFSASTRINREDFGMTWNQALETGGVLVSKDVDIEIEVQAAPQSATEAA
jgi:polyisoprenoid-binding protein YceI